ncbi:MAG TPA: hypothetical protein VE086_04685 [Chthoniobacterales bacterium]|nr:hypothetical protein [Chthoniobacterales bacterium]
MNAPVDARRRKLALWVLIPATVLFLCSVIPAALMIMFSPMAFDAGATRALWTFVIILWAYPVVVLLTIIAMWISFALGAFRLAMWWNLLPIIHCTALVIAMSFS